MFTVLIAEQQHIDSIRQRNSLFFEPFLDNKEIAFCEWRPEGQTLYEAVPGLIEAVGRRKKWRAVVINQATEAQLSKQNPYDLVDYSEVTSLAKPTAQPENGEDWSQWEAKWRAYFEEKTPRKEAVFRSALEHPLQKLATWLCFQPADFVLEDVPEKKGIEDWALEYVEHQEKKPGARLEALELSQYRCELRMKERIRREFTQGKSINIAYPAEFHCISERITEAGFFDPNPFWNVRSDMEYSGFADRNMYFDKMRFMVFDVLPYTHKDYRSDRIRFLYAVMVFLLNPTPISAMQARRLYRLDSENDETPLCLLATSYDRKLTETFKLIDDEIEKIRSEIPGALSDREAEALFCAPADVSVLLDKFGDEEALFAEDSYGLSGDCPSGEKTVWAGSYTESKRALGHVLKQRARAVRKSVDKLQYQSEVDSRSACRLNSFQMDDVRDYTETAEDTMVNHIPKGFTDPSVYTAPLEERSNEVKTVLDRRMSKKTTLILGGLVLAMYLICFLPLLFSNYGNIGMRTIALILIGGVLLVVAVILVITLFFLRLPLKRAVGNYNNEMAVVLNDVKESLNQVSIYLSANCNARRGHGVLNFSEKNVDEYTRSIRIRKRHQEDIRKKRACLLEDYGDFIAGKEYCDEIMSAPYDYDFNQKTEFTYPAPFLVGDTRQVEFLESGNFVTVPCGYIRNITVRLEEIYDK